MVAYLKNRRGQTMVEYLMLLAVTFIASYIMITGPMATFATGLLNNIRGGLSNVVQFGEWSTDTLAEPDPRHPGGRDRYKPLHL